MSAIAARTQQKGQSWPTEPTSETKTLLNQQDSTTAQSLNLPSGISGHSSPPTLLRHGRHHRRVLGHVEDVARRLGITADAIKMRVGNLKNVAEGRGLAHVARQTRLVFARFGSLSAAKLCSKAQRCLAKMPRRRLSG